HRHESAAVVALVCPGTHRPAVTLISSLPSPSHVPTSDCLVSTPDRIAPCPPVPLAALRLRRPAPATRSAFLGALAARAARGVAPSTGPPILVRVGREPRPDDGVELLAPVGRSVRELARLLDERLAPREVQRGAGAQEALKRRPELPLA